MTNQTITTTECCNEETLREYWNGHISEERIERIEAHLADCASCNELLNKIESHAQAGDLVESLRVMASMPTNSNQAASIESMIESPRQSPKHYGANGWSMPPQQIGPYRLLEPLGQGGMATVFVAEHTKLQKPVALKLVRFPKEQSDARSRFEREMLAIGKLNHPSIVSATDAGQEGDLQYLVMELVRGMDLSQVARRIPNMAIPDVCEIGRQIALALAHAHSQGFVHRDIKPSNVMLDEYGAIKVLDFGLVLFDQWDNAISELTTVGQFLGTLDYIAPEQSERSGGVDHRADLYALGATLFRLLCGHGPLSTSSSATPLEKLRLLSDHKPLKLHEMRPDAPASLCQLLDQLLQTDPSQRPIDATQVAVQLGTLCSEADLSSLIRKAMVAEEAVPSESPQVIPVSSRAQRSQPAKNRKQSTAPKTASGGRGRFTTWVALVLAACAGFALYGIIIRWDTKDGQLVIESELSDGEIKIKRVDDGSEQKLKIETGNTVTKLRAGEYQLELASGSDSVSIDNGSFVVATGKTVIARIRLEPTPGFAKSEPTAGAEADSQEPLYDGMPLSELLKLVRRENSYEKWKVGVIGALTILKVQADKALFDELYGILRERREFELLAQWQDPRIDESIAEELGKAPIGERASLLREAVYHFDLKKLPKTLSWIDLQHRESAVDAKDLFLALMGLSLVESQDGSKSVMGQKSGAISFQQWVTLEALHPELAHLYDDLAVECIANDDMTSVDYVERAARRLLSENRGSFGSRVWAIQQCLKSGKPELTELAERSYARLLSELPDAFGLEHTYRNQQPQGNHFGPQAPGLKSPAIHFASLAKQFFDKSMFEPQLYEAVITLVPRAQRAWEIYQTHNRGIRVGITMGQIWQSSVKPLLDPKFKSKLENQSESDFFEDSKALVFISFIRDSYSNQNQYDLAPIEFAKWCELVRRYGKDGGISTAELDAESTDYLKNILNTDALPKMLTFQSLLYAVETRNSPPLSGTSEARMREWVAKKIKAHDKNADGALDFNELKAYDARAEMSLIDTNGDARADVDELVRARARK
ncbi:MAG: protein kinase [Pirellula sp.]|nr:protein kinase [Pirellula sp.]